MFSYYFPSLSSLCLELNCYIERKLSVHWSHVVNNVENQMDMTENMLQMITLMARNGIYRAKKNGVCCIE